MHRLQNLKIGTRLWILVLLSLAMTVLSGAITNLSLSNVAASAGNTYNSVVLPNNYLQQVTNTYATVRVLVRDFPMGMIMEDQAYIDDDIATLQGAQESMSKILSDYRAHVVDAKMDNASIAEVDNLIAAFADVDTVVNSIIADVKTGDIDLVNANILKNFDDRNKAMRDAINALSDSNFALAESNNAHILKVQTRATVIGLTVLFISVVIVFLLAFFILKSITEPISKITEAIRKLAVGNVDVHVDSDAKDELGILARAFDSMSQNFYGQSKVLSKMSKGDFTGYSEIRGDEDIVNHAIQDMLDNNNRLLSTINDATNQLTGSVSQIANGAQSLAAGSTEQAATIQQLSDSIAQIHKQAETNSKLAEATASEVVQAGQLMETNLDYMNEMTLAMKDIEKESDAISQVIKMIDDIAFQTNILALNAAVEAARAGQHGKGFAVVADEVRNLASKSADAARNTAVLIENNVANVKRGSDIAVKTESSLREAGKIMNENVESMNLIKNGSIEQTTAINAVEANIGQISMVVQANSATAQQSAASAEELSSQSTMLSKTVNQFKLRDKGATVNPIQATGMSL